MSGSNEAKNGAPVTGEYEREFSDKELSQMLRGRVVRRMNPDELKAWTRGIHKVCSHSWVPALRYGYTNLMPFVDESCGTAYTDCHFRIGLSPKLLDPKQTTDEQLAVVILHETLHNIHRHAQRFERKGIPNIVMNYVTDLEINSVIAAGVCHIDLEAPINTRNRDAHWDWLIGEVVEVKTQEEADALNNAYKNSKNPVKVGDKEYQGILLPGKGAFWDMAPGMTAEQYLSIIDYEDYDQNNMPPMPPMPPIAGNGGNQSDKQNPSSGNESDSDSSIQQGSDQNGDHQDDGQGAGDDSGQNGVQGGQGDDQGDGQGGGSTTITVERTFEGGTRVFQSHGDGTETTLGDHRNWVDHVDLGKNPDVWKKVDELGIHPIERGLENSIRDQIAHDIEEYKRTNQQGYGGLHAVLDYAARGLRPPVVDWRQILRQITHKVTQEVTAGRQDYSYRKRRRRTTGPIGGLPNRSEVIYPGQIAYVPKIRFALDTSASMSKNEFRKALSEAEGIIRESNAAIEVVCVDAEAGEIYKAKNVAEIAEKMTGGGGTDMTAALKQVSEQKPRERPDVLIIATDGGFSWEHFVKNLSMIRGLEKTAVIILCVYKFDEDCYYASQESISSMAKKIKQAKRNAHLVQAWVESNRR